MKKRPVAKMVARTISHMGRANGPITFLLVTNLMRGTRANGSWTDCKMFR